MLESAIPAHLRKERKCPMSTPQNFTPPFPSYCARFPTQMEDLVIGIVGAQFASKSTFISPAISTLKTFVTKGSESLGPSFWEVVSVTDKQGAYNIAIIAYWRDTKVHSDWETKSGFKAWWESPERENEGHGWFQEVFSPTVDRFETVFSNDEHPEGAAHMQEGVSGQLQEHGYWGSMRDRLAVAQDDGLESEGPSAVNGSTNTSKTSDGSSSKRVRVPGKNNLCVIRSGQDWSDTLPSERTLYLETMHPVLIEGMNFLRDNGGEIGCYANNLWDVVDPTTHEASLERTFGLGFFDNLKSLEHWSKSHQTHINIFGGFLMYAKKLDNVLSLRLFHEVYVLEEGQQFFEYVGCHGETGMLNALRF